MKHIFLRTLLLAALLIYGGRVSRTMAQSDQAAPATSDRAPLSLVFLMDASGSMQENDPQRLRKAAAQAVVSLLNPEDEVAVVEYAAEGRAIISQDGQPWSRADRQEALFKAIEEIGDRGGYTDFYAGLRAGLTAFEGVPETHRKIMLLLTDGILEPNPLDPSYAPHHVSYRLAVTGKSRTQRQAIYDVIP
jgi:Mg-chelatase subunit ChlD